MASLKLERLAAREAVVRAQAEVDAFAAMPQALLLHLALALTLALTQP